jgi:predicted ferric reductase
MAHSLNNHFQLRDSTSNQQRNNAISIRYLLVVCGIFLAIVCLCRLGTNLHREYRRAIVLANLGHQRYWELIHIAWLAWLKKHLLYAPLWRKHYRRCVQISDISVGLLPGRWHSLLLLSWTVINLLWIIYPTSQSSSAVVTLRARAGTAALFNILPVLLFSLKNNPLIPLLNISFDTFNVFHRWLARLCIFEILLHVCAWLGGTRTSGWKNVSEGMYGVSFSCGGVSTIAAIIILLQAWSPLRHAFYETFLTLHKLLAVIVFFGIYLHLSVIHLPQSSWVYIIAAIWIFDTISRLVRLILRNIDRRKWKTDVTVWALEGGACRVTFHLRTFCCIKPGTHIYVWIPKIAIFQSHPFSVAWSEPQESGTDISVLIRARTGFTKELYDAVQGSKHIIFARGFCEGFYGNYNDLSSYGHVVLLAGGVGITHHVMYLKNLLEGYRDGIVAAECIHLVWCFPTSDYLNWVRPWMDKIFTIPCCEDVLRISLYLTQQDDMRGIGDLPKWVAISYGNGRCNVEDVIQDSVANGNGTLAVAVCGPASLSDAVRVEVRNRVERRAIDFFDAAFTY